MSRLQLPAGGLADDLVTLRTWQEEDVPALVEALQEREISRWAYRIPWPYGQAEATAFLAMAEADRAAERAAHLAVVDAGSGALLGGVGLAAVDWGNRSAEIGYWVKRDARNRGVARRAARLVVAWAVEDLGIDRIELHCAPDNAPSQRVAEAAGFEREGLLRGHLLTPDGRRDSVVYGLLAPRFRQGPVRSESMNG